jgi:hypothetical protein
MGVLHHYQRFPETFVGWEHVCVCGQTSRLRFSIVAPVPLALPMLLCAHCFRVLPLEVCQEELCEVCLVAAFAR